MMFEALAWMLIGHAVADYPLQGDWLSKAKNQTLELVPGQTIWPMALLSHAAIHAGAVRLATGSWFFAAAEFAAHTIIDYNKCRGLLSYNQDHVAHVACKICWALLLSGLISTASARDLGQWDSTDPTQQQIKEWYQGLMQPDAPQSSCCGEADAYWADDVHVRDGKTFVTITDDRPDEPRGRPHVPVGTEIEIPTNKLKWDRSNPTGHGIVFLSRNRFVFCYVQPGGV